MNYLITEKTTNEKIFAFIKSASWFYNPLEYNKLGIALFHNRYDLINNSELNSDAYSSFEEMKEDISAKYITPIYMMNHSLLSLSTSRYSGMYGHFDSGQIGFIYATDEISNCLGIKSIQEFESLVDNTISEYQDYLNDHNMYLIEFFEVKSNNEISDLIDSISACIKNDEFIDFISDFYTLDRYNISEVSSENIEIQTIKKISL